MRQWALSLLAASILFTVEPGTDATEGSVDAQKGKRPLEIAESSKAPAKRACLSISESEDSFPSLPSIEGLPSLGNESGEDAVAAGQPPQEAQAQDGSPAPDRMAEALAAIRQEMEGQEALGELINALRISMGMRALALYQQDFISQALIEDNPSVPILSILMDLEENGRDSTFFTQSITIHNNCRGEGITNADLRNDWLGREIGRCTGKGRR